MSIYSRFKILMDELTNLHLCQGVQPSDLADAVFECNYSNINLIKSDTYVQCIVSFEEINENIITRHSMRYTYTLTKCLIKIEQKIDDHNYKTQWDRNLKVSQLVNNICEVIRQIYPNRAEQDFLTSLPPELRSTIYKQLQLVA